MCEASSNMYVCIYMCMCKHIHMIVYIYIIYIHIYIYIYIQQENFRAGFTSEQNIPAFLPYGPVGFAAIYMYACIYVCFLRMFNFLRHVSMYVCYTCMKRMYVCMLFMYVWCVCMCDVYVCMYMYVYTLFIVFFVLLISMFSMCILCCVVNAYYYV